MSTTATPSDHTVPDRPVVIFGDSITSWGVIRGLRDLRIPIYLVSENGSGIASYSKYVEDVLVLEASTPDYIAKIEGWIRSCFTEKPILFVAGNDDALKILSQEHKHLTDFSIPAFPAWNAVDIVINKEKTYDLARALGIPTIDTRKVTSATELNNFFESSTFRYPLFLKCSYSRKFNSEYRTKGVVCYSKNEVVNAYNNYDGFLGALLIQELIPGDIDQIFAVLLALNKKGEVIAAFANEKVRAATLYGSTSLSSSSWNKTLIDRAVSIAEALGYTGFVGVQFKLDTRSGEYKLLEINGRFSVSVSLSQRCGTNMPELIYNEFKGINQPRLNEFAQNYKNRVLLWYPLSDFYLLFQKRFYQRPVHYLSSLKGAGYIIEPFSWRDPKPTLIMLRAKVMGLIRNILKLSTKRPKR